MPTILAPPPALTSTEVIAACDGRLSYRQLDAWCADGLLAAGCPGSGQRRRFSPVDLIVAQVCSKARALGVPLDLVHHLAAAIYARPVQEPAWAVLGPDGTVAFHDPAEPIEQLIGGAGVLLAIDGLAR